MAAENIFSRRQALRELNQLDIDWKAGVTVQTLLPDPYCPTSFRWVLNKLENKPTKIAMYGFKPKPRGFGNGGGGLERLVYVQSRGVYMTELEILEMRRPGHPILTNPSLSEEQRVILAGGLREIVDETGFRDVEIQTDYPGIFLSDYCYPSWVDSNSKVWPGGHRKITLWGKLESYKEDSIVEAEEIEITEWFDVSISLPKLFFNCAPDRPYISHVRSTLRAVLAIHRYQRETSDGFVPNIPGRVHPSWWHVFQVGRGDSRFPQQGYKLSPAEWYKLFEMMVVQRMEEADNDFLVKFLGVKREESLRREEERLARKWPVDSIDPATQNITQAVEESEDSEGIPTVEDMVRQEDEEYARWFEESLPESMRVLTQPSA